jgi:RNA polymerase sigma-70 factor (ECF subfamily)
LQGSQAPDDWELVELCLQDKNRHIPELIRRHYEFVVNLCYRFLLDTDLAREAAQDVFVRVYDNIEKIAHKKRPFAHWLCRVTANHCRNLGKRERRGKVIIENGKVDFWYEGSPFAPPDHLSSERRKTVEMVNGALAHLPVDERIVLVLREVAELDVGEIAKIQHAPAYTIRRRLHRAKDRVRRYITQEMIGGDSHGP